MSEFKKAKKKDLIRLIEEYRELINILESSTQNSEKQLIILDKEKDDKQLIYLKNRIRCVNDINQRSIYKKELNRLLELRS